MGQQRLVVVAGAVDDLRVFGRQMLVQGGRSVIPVPRLLFSGGAAHSGNVKGSTEGDISAFLGIPYAAPPVGEDRWRAPQPVEAWEGVLEATEYGDDCLQVIFPPNIFPGIRAPRRWTSANAW